MDRPGRLHEIGPLAASPETRTPNFRRRKKMMKNFFSEDRDEMKVFSASFLYLLPAWFVSSANCLFYCNYC